MRTKRPVQWALLALLALVVIGLSPTAAWPAGDHADCPPVSVQPVDPHYGGCSDSGESGHQAAIGCGCGASALPAPALLLDQQQPGTGALHQLATLLDANLAPPWRPPA